MLFFEIRYLSFYSVWNRKHDLFRYRNRDVFRIEIGRQRTLQKLFFFGSTYPPNGVCLCANVFCIFESKGRFKDFQFITTESIVHNTFCVNDNTNHQTIISSDEHLQE